jgi:hypothetical protein
MQEYTYKTPVALAISETVLRLAQDFAKQKNIQGINALDDIVADLIIDMSDTYISFIDLQHYLWQILDSIEKGEDLTVHKGVKRELAVINENLNDAREAYQGLVHSNTKLYAFVPLVRRQNKDATSK